MIVRAMRTEFYANVPAMDKWVEVNFVINDREARIKVHDVLGSDLRGLDLIGWVSDALFRLLLNGFYYSSNFTIVLAVIRLENGRLITQLHYGIGEVLNMVYSTGFMYAEVIGDAFELAFGD